MWNLLDVCQYLMVFKLSTFSALVLVVFYQSDLFLRKSLLFPCSSSIVILMIIFVATLALMSSKQRPPEDSKSTVKFVTIYFPTVTYFSIPTQTYNKPQQKANKWRHKDQDNKTQHAQKKQKNPAKTYTQEFMITGDSRARDILVY